MGRAHSSCHEVGHSCTIKDRFGYRAWHLDDRGGSVLLRGRGQRTQSVDRRRSQRARNQTLSTISVIGQYSHSRIRSSCNTVFIGWSAAAIMPYKICGGLSPCRGLASLLAQNITDNPSPSPPLLWCSTLTRTRSRGLLPSNGPKGLSPVGESPIHLMKTGAGGFEPPTSRLTAGHSAS